MPKKKLTAEQRKAIGERLKNARAAKKAKEIQDSPAKIDNSDVDKLLKRIEELERGKFFSQPQTPVKSITKYSIAAKDYPDPRERLAKETRLEPFGFSHNFELDWRVGKVNFDKDGVHYVEPRFELDLNVIVKDEEGNPTAKRYTLKTDMFFEDPDSFIDIANRHGIEVPENLMDDFMNEMRYMSARDWLIECFYPPKKTNPEDIKEEVIGNRLVKVFEKSSEETSTVPFGKLDKKL